MKQQDKLRNTLREYYDTQEVPFSESEWDQASSLLNAARRKRRIRIASLILATLFSSLIITWITFPGLMNKEKHLGTINSTQKSEPELSSATVEKSIPTELKKEFATNSNNKSLLSKSSQAPPTKNNNSSEKSSILAIDKPLQTVELVKTKSKLNPVEKTIPVEQAPTKYAGPAVTIISNPNLTHKQEKNKSEEPETSNDNTGKIPASDKNLIYSENQSPQKELSIVPVNPSPEPPATLALDDNKKEEVADFKKMKDPEEKILPLSQDTSHSIPSVNTSPAALPVIDTLPSSINNLVVDGVFYEAGAAWLNGWKGATKRDARGFSPVIGINYMNKLSDHFAFSFGVQYLRISHLSNSSKTSRVSTYKYGEESKVTVITPSTLHYLVAPLRFHYYLDKRNSFGAGINLAYLLNVDAKVTSYDESPGSKTNYSTTKLSGYTQGFSWFDSQLALFYTKKINRVLAVQTEIFIGLKDVKQDNFFGYAHKERNSGAKLTLVYYAFRKKDK